MWPAPDARPVLAAGLACLWLMAACSTSAPSALAPDAPATSPSAGSPAPYIPASPAAAAGAIAAPSTVAVVFSGLRQGTYPVHLHSRCSGAQAFHITVLGSLRTASGGSGSVDVPRAYFGRGLCLIVYTNASLSLVLTTRPI